MRIALAVAALAAFLVAAPFARAQSPPQLVGTVGPGFTIDLVDAAGKHVDLLTPGKYTLLIHDESDIHNFVLGKKETGERPASTEVEFVGDMTFTVDLTPGHWVYACSPHFQTMFGAFVVVPATTSSAPTRPSTLAARLTAAGASLSATRVTAGACSIRVSDRSKTKGFRLVGPGVSRATSAAFVGTTTWHVRLVHGTYRFGSGKLLPGRLIVS